MKNLSYRKTKIPPIVGMTNDNVILNVAQRNEESLLQ